MAIEKWRSCRGQVISPAAAELYWHKVMSDADRQRLGRDFSAICNSLGAAGLWLRLHDGTKKRAVLEVGRSIGVLSDLDYEWLLCELGEKSDLVEASIDVVVSAGGLVLIEQPNEAYWQNGLIEIRWEKNARLWDYFWQLALHSYRGDWMNEQAVVEEANRLCLARWKSRLTKMEEFPRSLAERIQVGHSRHKLDLPQSQISLFQIQRSETACRAN